MATKWPFFAHELLTKLHFIALWNYVQMNILWYANIDISMYIGEYEQNRQEQ